MPPEELEALRRRWQREGSPQLSLKLAEEYRRAGRLEEAIVVLQEGLRTHPRHVSSQVAMGRFCLELGHSERARDVLEGVVEKDPTHLVANKLLVKVHNDLGDPQRARDRLDLYVLLNDSDPEIEELEHIVAASEASRKRQETVSEDESFAGLDGESPAAVTRVAEPGPAAPVAPALAAGGVHVVSRQDPFSSLWQDGGESRYWESVSAEGIFSLESPAAAPAIAPPPAIEPAPAAEPSPPVAEGPEVAPAEAAAGGEEPSTATLGELYREQGHAREAEEIFRNILERQPEHSAARAGLEKIARHAAEPLTASELLAPRPLPPDAGPRERRRAVLEGYLERLRAARNRGV